MTNKMFLFLTACIYLSFAGAFTIQKDARKPDLQVQYPDPKIIKESGSTTVFEFTIKNVGTAAADLSQMVIRTTASATWNNPDGSQTNYPTREVSSELFRNLHYDRPPNPEQLEPGQSVTVRALVDCRFPLPKQGVDNGLYSLEVFVDSKNTIHELREDNNRISQNSIGLN